MGISVAFSPIPRSLIRNSEISLQSKSLYIILASHTTAQDRTCFPGRRRLCDLTGGWSTKTLDKYLGELISTGWLDREIRRDPHGRFRGWTYTVHLSPRGLEGGSSKPLADSHREVKITAPSILPPEEEPGNTPQEDTLPPVASVTSIPAEEPECVHHGDEPAQAAQEQILLVEPDMNDPQVPPSPAVTPQNDQAQVILLDPDQNDSQASPSKTIYIVRSTPQSKAQKPAIQDEVAAAITWQVQEAKKGGKLLNEGAYRRTLELLARRGEFDLAPYQRHVGTAQKVQIIQEQINQQWAAWEAERASAEEIRATLEQARRDPKLRALFLRRDGQV